MGLYKDETGLVFETDDAWARSHGYTPVTPEEQSDVGAAQGYADRADAAGPLGTLNAGATGLASGLTLGASDALLGLGLDDAAREQLLAEINAHPYARGVGELTGATLPALLSDGALARTPTGYLSKLSGGAIEDALAEGGVKGTAKALAAMGTEGALMNTGSYLGHTALEDKAVTAEGLQGAVGTGFEFGVAGGGAMLGITKGTIAARKLFSRVMDRGAEKVAESTWTMAAQQALDADAANADIAKQRLDEIRSMKEDALKAWQDDKASVKQEQIRAEAAGPQKPFVPEPSPPMTTEGGTQVIPRPPNLDELRATGAPPPEAPAEPPATPSPNGTQVIPGMRSGAGESVTPDYTAPESGIAPRRDYAEGASLGGQARGDRAMEQMQAAAEAAPTQERTGILGMLDELAAHEKSAKPLSSLAGMREATTAQLLGKQVAAEEAKLMEALQEFQAAKSRFIEHVVIPDPGVIQPKVPTEFAAPPRSSPADPEDVLKLQQGAGTAVGKRKAFDILDRAHENALERLQNAATPEERGIALRQADAIEQLLERVTPPSVQKDMVPNDFLGEVASKAKVVDAYEKSSAKLADAVGDAAHPASVEHAKAYAEASDEAVRKVTDRTTRAAEDADTFGPYQYAGPEAKTPRERVTYAKERAFESGRAYEKLSNEERAAAKAHAEAKQVVAKGERAKREALKVDAKKARTAQAGSARAHRLGVIGGVYEMLDIPGMPKVHDLPVVGPLLSAWLKYRAARTIIRGGRLPVSADLRVAALASRTRDRIAMAIDRSLGFATKVATAATKAAPLTAGVVNQRIYDDGGPLPPKDASLPKLVATRVRELSAYVNTPGAIENDVRRELRDVVDPDLIAAAEKQRRATMEYLLSVAPQAPALGALQKVEWNPSPAESMSFARRMQAAADPESVFKMLEAGREQLSLEAAETMRNVYPQLFMQAQQRILERAADLKESIPTAQRIRMSLVYQLPLDSGLDPDNLKITQSVFVRPAPAPAPAGATPPVPSIAQPTNLLPMYQLPSDRTR